GGEMRSLQGANAPDAGGKREPPRCAIEPIEETRFLFVDAFQKIRIENGEKPAERAVFRKQHGVAKGKLTVMPECPAEYRAGLWSGGPYVAWMRWSSDAPPDTPDQKNNTLGIRHQAFRGTGSDAGGGRPGCVDGR